MTYGVDDVDDAMEAPLEAETVAVPEFILQELAQRVNPLSESDNYGINLYQEAVEY